MTDTIADGEMEGWRIFPGLNVATAEPDPLGRGSSPLTATGEGLSEALKFATFVIAVAGKSRTRTSFEHSSLMSNSRAEFWAIGMRILLNKVNSTFYGNYFMAINYNDPLTVKHETSILKESFSTIEGDNFTELYIRC